MVVYFALVVMVGIGLAIVVQIRQSLGGAWAFGFGLGGLLLVASAWGSLEWSHRTAPPPPEDQTNSTPVSSQACMKCHESHHTSWQQTYHRTMTREASPENIKADFNNATQEYLGVTSRMTRKGDRFFIETVDPGFVIEKDRAGIPLDKAGTAPRRKFSVDRLVGSHWFQQMLTCDEYGRYLRLPLVYHIVEKRWIHVQGAFLAPSGHFFKNIAVWNESCIYCHNTRPVKNRLSAPDEVPTRYRSEVSELGIACEACHGSGERHVRAHQNLALRLAQRYSDEPDPTIVNPAKLSVERSVDVCARCHGGALPRLEAWDEKNTCRSVPRRARPQTLLEYRFFRKRHRQSDEIRIAGPGPKTAQPPRGAGWPILG